ncbi:MAG TPA: alpha/beta hydrolase [Rhizobiaceae bacterium]|nr:alpha/beta hydrolase [Rhizobiaceae bacterium]
MQKTERAIRTGGVELATEAFGDPANPPVLLIMGVMASMLWWADGFCEQLAKTGRYVIRYDNRDTGRSTTCEPGKPDYTFDDMTDDAARVLDGYGIKKAHIVGVSMGGMLAQRVALRHPGRVLSVTVISSSPVGVDTSDLPGMTEAYQAHSAEGEKVDWSDTAQIVEYVIKDTRAIAGTAFPYDASAARALVEKDAARARIYASITNHFMLVGGGVPLDVRNLQLPLLVIHGTADPLFPVEHGEALAEAVTASRMVRLEGGGHEIHPGHWDLIVSEIENHTAK